MAYTTKETSASQEQCTVKGTHWIKNMVKFWNNYAYWAKDAEATWTGAHAFGSRTAGSGLDLGTYEEGLLVASQYTDVAALANTTDYVGCSAIFDLKLGRAITLASGGGYGFATIWANLEVDKAINATGAQSAAWMTIWADAAGDDAHIRGTSRLQVLDLAIVTGTAFDASGSTKIYGLRIDSSVASGATMDGEFAAIDIGKSSSGKKNWTIGVDVQDATTGISIGGTYDHGIRFTEDPAGANVTNSFINIGDYTTGIAVAPTTANMFGVMHNVTLAVNVAYWYQAYYTKITTSGTTTSTSIAGHALRMQVGSSLGAVYGIQCHTNITATNTCAEEIASISTMVDLATGTVTTTDRVVALQALITGSGTAGTVTGLLHVAYFGNRGTQIDTDAIIFINNQSAAVSDVAIEFDLNGTVTNAFEFNGTVCDGWTSGDSTGADWDSQDEYVLIPVKVQGVTPQLYMIAAETWN